MSCYRSRSRDSRLWSIDFCIEDEEIESYVVYGFSNLYSSLSLNSKACVK